MGGNDKSLGDLDIDTIKRLIGDKIALYYGKMMLATHTTDVADEIDDFIDILGMWMNKIREKNDE